MKKLKKKKTTTHTRKETTNKLASRHKEVKIFLKQKVRFHSDAVCVCCPPISRDIYIQSA